MSESKSNNHSPSTAFVETRQSVILQARLRSQQAVKPVWVSPSLERSRRPAAAPVRDDALALALRLERALAAEPSIVVLSGLRSHAGVSTAAIELARTFARSHPEPVLLVDANLRRPTLAAKLGIPPGPGLSEVVQREATIDDVIHELEPGSLYAIPAGEPGERPASILASSDCIELLRSLRFHFGQIFLDTAPLGTFVDGAFLAAQAQYVVLFVERGRHQRSEVRQIVRELKAVGVHGVGLCLSTSR